ncbi:MAG TPA: hypothetical protein QGG47_06700 [Acidobacteriota bacterium]|nr:hypothetical protein [Acidobacteriota bacterium]
MAGCCFQDLSKDNDFLMQSATSGGLASFGHAFLVPVNPVLLNLPGRYLRQPHVAEERQKVHT